MVDDTTLYLGIDYGGNAVKVGLIDRLGQLFGKESFPSQHLTDKASCREFASQIHDFVHGLGIYSSELGGIGLAVPGVLSKSLEDKFFPNVHLNWSLFIDCLKQLFNQSDIPTINDANAAALGEMWKGAGSNAQSALLVTLGSGIGAGLIVEGTVISGAHGAAGEIGHMTVVPDGRECSCGRKGCLERYASARGIVQTFREAEESGSLDPSSFSTFEPENDVDALSVFRAFKAGDQRAEEALVVMCEKLGFALAQVSCVCDPEVILIAGGIASGAEYYIEGLRHAYESYCLDTSKATEIRIANLEGDAGIFGAARRAMLAHPQFDSNGFIPQV